MISVLEESFRNVLAKMFGSDENFDVIMNPDKGDCEIYQNLKVVADDDVDNEDMEIGLSEAREIDPECEIGEEVSKQIFFEKFGRRAILNLRQTLQSKILDLQNEAKSSKFKELEGKSSRVRSIRYGSARRCLSMRSKTSSQCPRRNRFQAIISTRATWSAP